MTEIKIEIEEIENGLLVSFNGSKQYFFKNEWGLGKYIQEQIEKMIPIKNKRESG
jgi:hypothetical protein